MGVEAGPIAQRIGNERMLYCSRVLPVKMFKYSDVMGIGSIASGPIRSENYCMLSMSKVTIKTVSLLLKTLTQS